MDIKDFILIGGGILIALVVGHGFWIAWRAKREPLRLDIVPDLVGDDVDEIERLRGELPNGGARVVHNREPAPEQENLELDQAAPLLMTPAEADTEQVADEDDPGLAAFTRPAKKLRPKVHQAPPRNPVVRDVETTAGAGEADDEQVDDSSSRTHVREVQMELDPIVTEAPSSRRGKARARVTTAARKESRKRETASIADAANETATEAPRDAPAVEELLIINILAPRGERFDGEGLVNALRGQGLRYGDMNIFHRIDAATKAKLYSVANAVEPGTFDLSDLGNMRSPGMTFFLQLPGPDDAITMFEDMLQAARNVSVEIGGELRDEDLSMLTGQTVEHMRQRIADYSRRRLSKRA